MRLPVARLLLLVCALLAVVPAAANAATPPKVTSVAPLKLKIGERLTIRGKGFLAGKNRNTVLFKATGARAVFVKAESATSTVLVVKVPAKLAPFLKAASGTRFQLRVLARRLSPAYTPAGKSPVIAAATVAPAATGAKTTTTATAATGSTPPATAPAAVVPDCDKDGIPDATDTDDDNDRLPDTTEVAIGTNRCSADTDGDGVSDVFEYESALDLNGRSVRYPSGGAYPDPTDGSDVDYDFDGDGMTLAEEYTLWKRSGGALPLTYSDGDQDTTGTGNTPDVTSAAITPALDRDGNGHLTDDEKDLDGDGLTNWEERHGMMLIAWWGSAYPDEKSFASRPGAAALYETNWLVGDTDGDGILDGADDQDHDGWTNVAELSRSASGHWVNPYNPCLPNPSSRVCTLHPPFAEAWAPFDENGRLPTDPAAYDSDGELVWPQP